MNIPPVQRLSHKEAERFLRYMELFVTYSPRTSSGFFQKNSYCSGFIQPKMKNKTKPLALIGEIGISTVERHLDHKLWWDWQNAIKHRCLPQNPIWLALNAPQWIRHDAIDVDTKDHIIGYYSSTLMSYDRQPVVFLRLPHFEKLKRIYDHFPNRIWCISSESLGLHIWRQYGSLQKIEAIQSGTKAELASIGLGSTEVHPMPGRAFRRPFGLHYRTITDNGILETWQEQLDYFVEPSETPSFSWIVKSLIKAMMNQVNMWKSSKYRFVDDSDESEISNSLPIDEIRAEIKRILAWVNNGCPATRQVANLKSYNNKDVEYEGKTDWYHQMVQFAINGLPGDDTISDVVIKLATWLYWIDLYEVPENDRMVQIKEILKSYILSKNNGYVTRLNNGNERKVFDHINRMVHYASEIDRKESLQSFENVRNNIANNNYKNKTRIVDLLTSKNLPTSGSLTYMCMPPKKLDPHSPLPEAIEEKIKQNQGMKKVFPFANVLLNKIASCGGKARVGRQWFIANGFKDPNKTQQRIDILIKAGVLRRGTNYSVRRFGIEYSIPPKMLEYFRE